MKKYIFITFGVMLCLLFSLIQYGQWREFHHFFENEEDRLWAKDFWKNDFNFCTQDWPYSKEEPLPNLTIYRSPSNRYRVIETMDDSKDFLVEDTKNHEIVFSKKHDEPAGFHVKWARHERYIIYQVLVYKDKDFAEPEIYIGNLRTGQVIYLADSTEFNCNEFHWWQEQERNRHRERAGNHQK